MEEYEVIERNGKKIRKLPDKYNELDNQRFIAPLIRYKMTEDLSKSLPIAKKIIDLCNYKRPTIIFSKSQILAGVSVNILEKFYNKSITYRIMEGTDIIAAYFGESVDMDATNFLYCDLLIVNLSLINEQAMRALQYLDVQLLERYRLGKNTIVFFEGTLQRYKSLGGILKHFENVVDTVTLKVFRGRELAEGKSFNDVTGDVSVKKVHI